MEYQRAPEWLVETFERVAPSEPPVEVRKMFGYPCRFIGGNMFTGLYQGSMVVRLPADARAELLKVEGAAIFEPSPGRVMKEYVVVPPAMLAATETLRPWLERSRAYAASLPVKEKKPAKASAARKAAKWAG